MGVFGKALSNSRKAWSDPNSLVRQMTAEFKAKNAYLDDPSIPEHDKMLQLALDSDVKDPMLRIEKDRGLYEHLCRTGDFLDDDLYETYGFESDEEVKAMLATSLSDESIRKRVEEYRQHLSLREEAIRKGFTKGGCCVRCGDNK